METPSLENPNLRIPKIRHLPNGVELTHSHIDFKLPHIAYLRNHEPVFTVQRGNSSNQLRVYIENNQVALQEIAEYLQEWLNKPPFVFYEEVFYKLFRHDMSERTDGEWVNKCYGALGAIDYYIDHTLPDLYPERAMPIIAEEQFQEGYVDYSKPFYSMQLTDLETLVDPRPLHHTADIQINENGTLVVEFNPNDFDKREFDYVIGKLRSSSLAPSIQDSIHLWGKMLSAQLWSYRQDHRVFEKAPWNEDIGFEFLNDHSAYRAWILGPLLFNSTNDLWHLEDKRVNESRPHIRIERYAHNRRNKTRLIGLISISPNDSIHLELKDEWFQLSKKDQHQIKMWLQKDVFLAYDFKEVTQNLYRRSAKTTYLLNEYRGAAKPNLSFTHMKNEVSQSTYQELKGLET